MKLKNVKNTMLYGLFNIAAPHYCYSCDKIGQILCEYCKYDIVIESDLSCLLCHQPTSVGSLCNKCPASFSRAWSIGAKSGVLQQIIYDFKFERVKDCGQVLSSLLSVSIGQLPSGTVVVPIPTITRHIRQRGYDHASLLARDVAFQNDCEYREILARNNNYTQRGANRKKRLEQAKTAFTTSEQCRPDKIYLIVDDVITTGATLEYAARALKEAGAREVWVAVAMYQDNKS